MYSSTRLGMLKTLLDVYALTSYFRYKLTNVSNPSIYDNNIKAD